MIERWKNLSELVHCSILGKLKVIDDDVNMTCAFTAGHQFIKRSNEYNKSH